MIKTSKIHNESCLDTMKRMDKDVIDLICCDPPYGYSFMGKDWDKVVMGVEYWQECLRVLKAGAFCFVMASPRQDVLSRQIIRLQDAGFDVGFTSIYWAYASGFPKAGNIGKMVDKRMGAERKVIGVNKEFKAKRKASIERGQDNWNKNAQLKGLTDKQAGFQNEEAVGDITEPNSPQAKELDGSYAGYQPKPAVEVVIVAMKPLSEKTFIDQALKNKKGITWLGDCRVPYESEGDKGSATPQGKCTSKDIHTGAEPDAGNNEERIEFERPEQQGRFPANLLVSDGIVDDGENKTHGTSDKPYSYQGKEYKAEGFIKDIRHNGPSNYGDDGSFSRYFDLDKWWEERIKELPKKVQKSYPFLIVPKAGKSEKNDGADNNHPTVKPVKLMSYLITLGSRPDDIIYDPFCGSGTTLISAEITRRKWIGSEISKEYHKIAEERIKRELHQLKLF